MCEVRIIFSYVYHFTFICIEFYHLFCSTLRRSFCNSYKQAAVFVTTLFASFSSLFINMLNNMGSHPGPSRT